MLAGSRWQEQGLVFTSTIGTPLDGPNVTHRFQEHIAAAGLPRQWFHDLRHACASQLLAQGVSPRVVMETLGHSQIGITMNLYAHVMPTLQRDAAERMEALLGRFQSPWPHWWLQRAIQRGCDLERPCGSTRGFVVGEVRFERTTCGV